jgi:ankyrin repeat protein
MSLIEELSSAVLDNNIEQVKSFIEAGVDVNEPLEGNHTILMIAASNGHFSIVRELIAAGSDVDIVSDHDDHALSQAAQGCYSEVFNYLYPLSSVEIRQWACEYALLSAAADHNAQVVQLLAQFHINLDVRSDIDGQTTLMLATQFRNVDFVKELLKAGVAIDATDYKGRTALMYAVNPRSREEAGMLEIIEKQIQLIQLLAESDASLNSTDSDGKTPLIFAAKYGSPQVVKCLLSLKSDKTIKDSQGYDALAYAREREALINKDKNVRSEIIQLLQQENL